MTTNCELLRPMMARCSPSHTRGLVFRHQVVREVQCGDLIELSGQLVTLQLSLPGTDQSLYETGDSGRSARGEKGRVRWAAGCARVRSPAPQRCRALSAVPWRPTWNDRALNRTERFAMAGIGDTLMRAGMKTQIFLYRRTAGRIGGKVSGQPILLLTTIGRKTGQTRTSPLMYLRHGDDLLVTASANGADRNPGWFYNLVAQPDVDVEIGPDLVKMRARVTEKEERDALYKRFSDSLSRFAGYEEKTSRVIPVVALAPIVDQ